MTVNSTGMRRFSARITVGVLTACLLLLAVWASGGLAGGDGAGSRSRPPRKGLVVFVVDSSSSMLIRDVARGQGTVSRLEGAVRELERTLEGLETGGDFLFDIVTCSSQIEVLSGALGEKGPLPLNEANRIAAGKFLALPGRRGMTRLYEAILQSFRLCERAEGRGEPGTVFLYTDGIPTFAGQTEGPKTVEEFFPGIRTANRNRTRINAYAVSPTSEGIAFLKRLCDESGGILFVR
ncbi:MAG: hypothetical protein ACYS47_03250 [Planctomycetota bacterium]|jgi:hypothetical protein